MAGGALAGIGGALVLSRFVESFLFGVAPPDPASFMLAATVLVTAGAIAALLPAYRASVINPVEALKAD